MRRVALTLAAVAGVTLFSAGVPFGVWALRHPGESDSEPIFALSGLISGLCLLGAAYAGNLEREEEMPPTAFVALSLLAIVVAGPMWFLAMVWLDRWVGL